jgi:TfoX/Sxy family transcriptional regulator of competence genes
MGKWQQPPEKLVSLFDDLVKTLPGVETRKMFGYPCCFRNGQMFAGLFQDKMFLRLEEVDREMFFCEKGASPFEPMPGRLMREYAVVPNQVLSSRSDLEAWLKRSLDYVEHLGPKERKGKRKKTQDKPM